MGLNARTRRAAPRSSSLRVSGLVAERVEQPGARVGPVAIGGGGGDAQHGCGLALAQSAEEAQRDQLSLLRILLRQTFERGVEVEQLRRRRVDEQLRRVELDALALAGPLLRPALARAIDQDAPHGLRRRAEEVPAAIPAVRAAILRPQDAQVGLVHERRGVQRGRAGLAAQALGGELAQLGVDQRQELGRGLRIAGSGRLERSRQLQIHSLIVLAPTRADFPWGSSRALCAWGVERRSRTDGSEWEVLAGRNGAAGRSLEVGISMSSERSVAARVRRGLAGVAVWMAAATLAGAQRAEVGDVEHLAVEFAPAQVGEAAFVPFAPTPATGEVKVLVAREALDDFLASGAAASAVLVSESALARVYRIDARDAALVEGLAGVEVRPEFHQVWLRRGVLDTRSGTRAADGVLHAGFDVRRMALAQFHGPVSDAEHAALVATGVELVHYLPQNAYLVWIASDDARARLLALRGDSSGLAFVDAFLPGDVVSPQLDGASGAIDVTVQVFNSLAQRAAKPLERAAVLEALGFALELLREPEDVLEGVYTNLTVRVQAGALETLALLDAVVNVEPYERPRQLSERQAQEVRGAWNAAGTGAAGPGYLSFLSNKGFPSTQSSYPIVAVVDSGIDNGTTAPVDTTLLANGLPGMPSRIVAFANYSTASSAKCINGHGHLCASVIAGMELTSTSLDGTFLRGVGVAPQGRISNVKFLGDDGFGSWVSYGTLAESAWGQGARVSSNSWGSDAAGAYTSSAQQHDQLARDASATSGHQQMLFVFAAGNDGVTGIGAPATAKNVLSVGATEGSDAQSGCSGASAADNIQQIASFSSRGPTADGRSKPEVVAPGTHVVGTASPAGGYDGSSVCASYYPSGQTTYTWANGTSFAAPAISGVSSLEWNYLSRVHGFTDPSPALLKAYTLHQTRYLVATGGNLPNGNQGFGFPWLELAFDSNFARKFADQNTLFNSTGEHREFVGTVADSTRPVRVALVWTDAPGSTFGAAWVNDLNLTATVGANTYRGNVFSGGLSTTGGSADLNDNSELVVLPTGLGGTIRVRVSAANIAGDGVPGNADATDQDFALVIANMNYASGCTPPTLIANLTANAASACTGSPLTLSVAASGSSLSYKFYRDGQTVQSSGSNTYSVASAGAVDAGTYTCLIGNGCGEALSAPVTVVVNSAPSAAQQPTDLALCSGSPGQLQFVASGTPAPTYQWKRNGVDIPGATSSTHSISSMNAGLADSYQCNATNVCGVTISNSVVLTQLTTPVISQQPQSMGVCSGASAQLSIAISNFTPGTTYQWLRNNVAIIGATSATLNLGPVTSGNAGTYTCVVTNSCGFTFSSQAIVTEYTAPNITTQPASQSFCVGVPFGFSVAISNTTPTPSYQWRKNGAPIVGATNSSYSGAGSSANDGVYDCVVTNSCGSTTSTAASYTARVAPTITVQPQNTALCAGVNGVLNVSASGTAQISYQWFHNGVGLGSFTNSAHTIFNPSGASAGQYFCRVTNVCGTVDSNVITVTVDTAPTIQAQPAGATICAPAPVSFSVGASGSPNLSYQWRRNSTPLAGATNATLVLASPGAADAGFYDCVISSTCTSVASNAAVLVVNVGPLVTQQPFGAAPCVGSPALFTVAANATPTPTFQWRKGGAPIAGATAATLAIAAASAADVGSYDCVVSNSCGSTTSAPAALTLGAPDACVAGGPGGAWPGSGAADGGWPSVLPTGELISTLSVNAPASATRISAVKLSGLSHAWSGDNQIVLETPSGARINLFQQLDGAFGGGCGVPFSGDYSFIDLNGSTGSCGVAASDFACVGGAIAPGVYRQFFGAWPSGAAGIDNTALSALPLDSGLYTLRIYDWFVGADNGSLASWELCFDSSPPPLAYCTGGTTTNGCAASIDASGQPSASFATPCALSVTNVEGGKSGLVFYGVSGSQIAPWNNVSFLCVKTPVQRTTGQFSGGTPGACDGQFTLDWNAYQTQNPLSLGNPFGPGAKVWAQAWFRDPPAQGTTNLSNAVELTYAP